MKRLSWFASVIALALGMGTASMLHGDRPVTAKDNVAQTANGAFRDGLYLGRLSAGRGTGMNMASGRWATEADRASGSRVGQWASLPFPPCRGGLWEG